MADITGMLQAAAGAGGEEAGYQISRSLRFNSADSAYLSRTPGTAGNRKTWTWSGWVKRSKLGSRQIFWNAGSAGDNLGIEFSSGDQLEFYQYTSSYLFRLVTTPVYRDLSAWYHIVAVLDTTQATSSDRAKIYVNGVQVTALGTATYPTQNTDYLLNSTVVHYISGVSGASLYFDGYQAELNLIDGQALTPSDFGGNNPTTGVWEPLPYIGTYGTNGFHLPFSDNTSTTTIGYDTSGNGNNWTANNFSVAAGAGNDSMVDTPTSYGTDTGAGGEVRGNYATLNPLAKGTNVTVSNGGLDYTAPNSASSFGSVISTIGMSSGKWYCEYVWTSGASNSHIGVATNALNLNTYLGGSAAGYSYYASGLKYNNASSTAYGASYANGDVIGVAFDADAGTLTFYKNNVSQGTAFTGLTNGPYFFGIGMGDAGQTATINFGQRPFAYTAPSGYKALCTQNLPDPTIVQGDDYFNTVLYTGNGFATAGTQTISGVGFQPDFVWIKSRSAASSNHSLYDAVRTAGNTLVSNSTAAETSQTDSLTAFTSDGFSLGDNSESGANVNVNTATYVAWNWNAGGSNATNTDGTITSTVRANTTSGFSIVSFSNPTTGSTIGHGLGVAPKMMFVKDRGSVANWQVYVEALGNNANLRLNTTDGTNSPSNLWNTTSPTSSVFTFGSGFAGSYSYIVYCFAEVEGYSKFGSYTGNGSTDGTFVYANHRPAFIMVKRTDTTSNWTIIDTKREGYNVDNDPLYPNLSNAEGTTDLADILSNGFKLRSTDASVNASGGTYIFMSLASNPFKYSLGR